MMEAKTVVRRVAPYVALLILTAVVYANTLSNQFVWDDRILIVDNHLIENWRNLPSFFSRSFFELEDEGMLQGGYYRPFILLTYVADYAIWGLRAVGYHLTNILTHSLNVLLFFHFFRSLTQNHNARNGPALAAGAQCATPLQATLHQDDGCGTASASFFGALLYAVSPVHTNAVTYITGRTDLFATFFFLLSLMSYRVFSRSSERRSLLHLFGSLVFFSLSLLCKESTVILPLIVVLYDVCFVGRFKKGIAWRAVAPYVPYALILAGYFFIRGRVVHLEAGFAINSVSDMTYRIATIIKSVVLYWRLLLFPVGLSFERSVEVVHSLASPIFMPYLLVFCASLVLLVRWWGLDKQLFFCLMWFFIGFAPVSNLLPIFPSIIATHHYAAEQLMYLPSMGLFVLAGYFISTAYGRIENDEKRLFRKRQSVVLVFLVALTFFALTIRRNRDWKDEKTFYERTLAANPTSVRIMNNLGIVYKEQKRYSRALELFESAVKLQSDFVSAYNNIASVYQDLGSSERAEGYYRKAVGIDEKNLRAHFELAKILEESGRLSESETHLSALTKWYPAFSAGHHEMGRVLMAEGRYRDAIEEFQKALEGSPNPDVVLNSIGIAYARQGDYGRAEQSFRLALGANPESYQAHVNLGSVYLEQGFKDRALEEYERALRIRPDLTGIQDRVRGLRAREE
ncbi:tetratricopeptide repeat protein [Candidatus Poribacteria bacterium]|nr:tetratricopeptide repeat protein [Candidatus Poribacteria bacterium]